MSEEHLDENRDETVEESTGGSVSNWGSYDSEHSHHHWGGNGDLAHCERLRPKLGCERIYLSQILPLMRRHPKSCALVPVTVPAGDISKICQLRRNRKEILNRIRAFVLARDPKIFDAGISHPVLEHQLGRLDRQAVARRAESVGTSDSGEEISTDVRATSTMERVDRSPLRAETVKLEPELQEILLKRAAEQVEKLRAPFSQLSRVSLSGAVRPRLPRPPVALNTSLIDRMRSLIGALPIRQPHEVRPAVGFQITYLQRWCSKGYRRGRLIRSIPLTADGRKEIGIKSWTIRKQRREENESVENDISTEIVGDEKWTQATSKQLSAELNQTIDAKLNVSGEIPLKGVKAGVDVGNSTSGALSSSITDTEERIHQATIKSTDSLKKRVASTIETSEESGLETTITETIVNPNKCNTLTYHFFEVTELYDVTTRVHRVDPVLLVALPKPAITPKWLLCHECLLRKHLPCETYYAGFDAAKTVLSQELLGEFLGSLDSDVVRQAADATLDAVRAVVDAYLMLSSASPSLIPNGGGDLNLLEAGWAGLMAGLDAAGNALEDLNEAANDTVDAIVDAGEDVIDGVVDGFESAMDSVFSIQARTAPGAVALARPSSSGGVGSYIYWQVARIAAPELGNALSGLEAAYGQISNMPAGPARVNALVGAIRTFFQTLGDVDEVFSKIDAGLGVVAVGLAATTFAGAAAVVALIAVTGVATFGAAVALLGAAALVSLGELVVLIVAMLGNDENIDLIPDDEGLKAAVGGLYGLFQQLGQSADLPVPPQSNDPAATAAYQQELQDAKRRRRELAVAQVELDRLMCHIKENLSYYAQVYWSSISSADLERILRTDFNIPTHVVESRIVGFQGIYAAFLVTNRHWLRLSGINLPEEIEKLKGTDLFIKDRLSTEIEMPSRGLTVEPELGECSACDDFVHFHREQDMKIRLEEVEQARLESRRLYERINRGLLGDPSPFEGTSELSLSMPAPSDTATPPPDAGTTGSGSPP